MKKPTVIIKGVAMWSDLTTPNSMSNKYQINVTQLDDKSVKALEDVGIKVTKGAGEKAAYGKYVTLKSSQKLFKVVDAKKQELPEGTKIGNGSKVTASVTAYPWEFKGKKGVGAGIKAILVNELVEFGGDALSDFEDPTEELPF